MSTAQLEAQDDPITIPDEPVVQMFLVPEPLLQAAANLLAARPYAEVANVLNALLLLQPVEESAD